MNLRVKILTIFPEIFPGPLGISLLGSGLKNNIWSLEVINIRDFGLTKHKSTDDEPYGGGCGMVMRADVLGASINSALEDMQNPEIIYMSPRGKTFNQAIAKEISLAKELIIICGRFEGIDERIIEEYNASEISIGDFVLTGGETAAITVLEAAIRLLPGILSNQNTLNEESFRNYNNLGALLEYPQYTRPNIWKGRAVPDVLLSGNHQQIREWRLEKSLEITKLRRPDLLKD